MFYENDVIKRELALKSVDCLNGQGSVTFVDCMGADSSIVFAARTSYGAQVTDNFVSNRGLIRRLMRDKHTTPFEMAELQFIIECPMDMWRQWIRHRTANVNEYSTRYKPAIDRKAVTPSNKWRMQAKVNKQGSDGYLDANIGTELSAAELRLHMTSDEVYQKRLELGVAREQARKDLPLSTFTRAVWKCDLHNILNFLRLRLDPHAQEEIREYAGVLYDFTRQLFPLTCEAFNDFVVESVTFSKHDKLMLRYMMRRSGDVVPCTFADYFDAVCDLVSKGQLPSFWLGAAGGDLTNKALDCYLTNEALDCWHKLVALDAVLDTREEWIASLGK